MGKIISTKKFIDIAKQVQIFVDFRIYPSEAHTLYLTLSKQSIVSNILCEMDSILVLSTLIRDIEDMNLSEKEIQEDSSYYDIPVHIFELEYILQAVQSGIKNWDTKNAECDLEQLKEIEGRLLLLIGKYKKQIHEFDFIRDRKKKTSIIKFIWKRGFMFEE